MARCLVGCGSNLGPRRDLLDRAMELLRFMPGVTVLQTSHFRESKAIGGPADQPAFLNGACLLETDLPPADLLDTLQAVENTLERQREVRWGPRTIDLDLLLYDTLQCEEDDLTVPHPRMTTRRFVLEPCVEIAPDFVHPATGHSIRDLLNNISLPHHQIAVCGIPGSGASEVATTLADATLGHTTHGCMSLPHALLQTAPDARLQASLKTVSTWHDLLTNHEAREWPTHVADFWVGSLAATATLAGELDEQIACAELAKRMTGATVPHVLIVLRVSTAALQERIRFCQGPYASGSDIFSDLQLCLQAESAGCGELAPAAHSTATVADWCDRLLAYQTQIDRVLSRARDLFPAEAIPKAIVRIDADDLGEAADEALAAVEAMA